MDLNKILKRLPAELSSNKSINELKILALKDVLGKLPVEHSVLLYLENLKLTVIKSIKNLSDEKNIDNESLVINTLKLQVYIMKNILTEALVEYSKDKNINFKKYFTKCFLEIEKININNKSNKRKTIDIQDKNKNKNKKVCQNYNKHNDNDNDYIVDDNAEDEDDYGDNDESDIDDIIDDDDDDEDEDEDDDDEDEDGCVNESKYEGKNEDIIFINQIENISTNDTKKIINGYFSNLEVEEKKIILSKLKNIKNYHCLNKPLLFTLISMEIPDNQKNYIIKKYLSLVSGRSESNKLKEWIDAIVTIPFGKYIGTDMKTIKNNNIKKFLDNLNKLMDDAVWGHDEAKHHIIQIIGQKFRNSNSSGNNIGIWGPPGNGKTTLIKEGIAKAMNRPFVFISLGGATDSSILEGHSYTYEGSIYGRIVNGLINTKCMNPIIYFDELDKVSKTHKGDEIINLLIHLTDPVQNSHFRDKYFHGIDLDLSKATFIFSYNDPSLINHVLLDRITQVETKYLLINQKIYISQNYLIPNILKEIGFKDKSVNITDKLIIYIIDKYTNEGGIRKLKEIFFCIMREINVANLTKTKLDNKLIKFPHQITENNIISILKHKNEMNGETINNIDKYGVINGMYATTSGIGGIMPIEVLWIPTSLPYEIKATGNLLQVIKESTFVASSLAFNYLDSKKQDEYLKQWKDKPRGLHIHCPEGSTPKDGPSAGTALTVAIYSMLIKKKIKHDIAITGEINLQGQVTAIGGLENKLEGAKKAGVKLALFPKQNQKDIDKIKKRNPTLIDENFKVQSIETIDDAISYAII
jgi:ATP-dependent Lon protease